ncbi:hypothetical protein HDF11_004796 [Tunturiibacter psychrotolerans]
MNSSGPAFRPTKTPMLSKPRSKLEAEYEASDASYRELVKQTVSLVLRSSGLGVAPLKALDELETQRRAALRECNRIFAAMQEVSMKRLS